MVLAFTDPAGGLFAMGKKPSQCLMGVKCILCALGLAVFHDNACDGIGLQGRSWIHGGVLTFRQAFRTVENRARIARSPRVRSGGSSGAEAKPDQAFTPGGLCPPDGLAKGECIGEKFYHF